MKKIYCDICGIEVSIDKILTCGLHFKVIIQCVSSKYNVKDLPSCIDVCDKCATKIKNYIDMLIAKQKVES